MKKERLIAIVLIVISWVLLDILFHGGILNADYIATAQLWRSQADMSQLFMTIIGLLSAFVFVFIYCQLISEKSLQKGIKLGAFIGVLNGIYFGVGSYGYMPITTKIALVWFLANVVKFTVAGGLSGYFVKTKA